MSAWGGFWIAVAIIIVGTGWWSRVDCNLGLKAACSSINATYMPKPHNPAR